MVKSGEVFTYLAWPCQRINFINQTRQLLSRSMRDAGGPDLEDLKMIILPKGSKLRQKEARNTLKSTPPLKKKELSLHTVFLNTSHLANFLVRKFQNWQNRLEVLNQ